MSQCTLADLQLTTSSVVGFGGSELKIICSSAYPRLSKRATAPVLQARCFGSAAIVESPASSRCS